MDPDQDGGERQMLMQKLMNKMLYHLLSLLYAQDISNLHDSLPAQTI